MHDGKQVHTQHESVQLTLEKLKAKGLAAIQWGSWRLTFRGEEVAAWLVITNQA